MDAKVTVEDRSICQVKDGRWTTSWPYPDNPSHDHHLIHARWEGTLVCEIREPIAFARVRVRLIFVLAWEQFPYPAMFQIDFVRNLSEVNDLSFTVATWAIFPFFVALVPCAVQSWVCPIQHCSVSTCLGGRWCNRECIERPARPFLQRTSMRWSIQLYARILAQLALS